MNTDPTSFPVEVLQHIWSFVPSLIPGFELHSAYGLASVCRRWREVAIRTPFLWGTFSIEHESGGLPSSIRLAITRSQGTLLTIKFLKTSPDAMRELAKTTDNWYSIWMGFNSHDTVFKFLEHTYIKNNDFKLPNLREVTVDLTRPEDAPWWTEEAGRTVGGVDDRIWLGLKTFNITCDSFLDWMGFIPEKISNFTLNCGRVLEGELSTFSHYNPYVVRMTLNVRMFLFDGSKRVLPFTELEELTFGESCPTQFIVGLSREHRLRTLTWRPIAYSMSSLFHGPFTWGSPASKITRLEIDLSTKFHKSANFYSIEKGDATSILHFCPMLQVLIVRDDPPSKVGLDRARLQLGNSDQFFVELLQVLNHPEKRLTSLTSMEFYNLYMKRSYLYTLATKVRSNALGDNTLPEPSLTFRGCEGILWRDCRFVIKHRLAWINFEE